MHERVKWIFAVILLVAGVTLLASQGQHGSPFELVSTIAFSSTRQNPHCNAFLAAEIFLMSANGTNVQRLTDSGSCTHADSFATLSPGKKIVFDSNRLTTNILFDTPMGIPV